MKLLPLILLSSALLASPVRGQVKEGSVQPDRTEFGRVHTGALVEASFLIWAAPSMEKNPKFEVTAPSFIKVLRKETDVWMVGEKRLRGTVEFALDTSRAGEFSGEIAVQLNTTSARVPVSASIKHRRANQLRVLVVETPFTRYSTNDGRHFKQWTDLVAAAPWDVHYLLSHNDQPVLRDLKLADFGALLLGDEGIAWLQPADGARLRAYMEDGGCVLVTANSFFRGTVEKANKLLTPYGVELADTETRIAGGDITIEQDGLDAKLVKAGIEKVTFFRASPATVTNPLLARVLVKAANVGRSGDGFVVRANAGNGKIIVIGQSLWWDWVTPRRDPHGGNAKLLAWLLNNAYQRRQRFLALKQPLSREQLATCWDRLAADDLDEVSEARHWLTHARGAARQTVPFLKDHLRPDPRPDEERIKRLIARLDDESFQTREKAQSELDAMGDLATALLKKTLDAKPTPEVRRRIEAILNKAQQPSRAKRQSLQAIEILEQLATPRAQELLRSLSQGAPGTQVTLAAQAALERLTSASKSRVRSETKPDQRR